MTYHGSPEKTLADFEEPTNSRLLNVASLLISLAAGIVIFLPFAFNTSPWDAITLRVPGNQGNWWHALIGVPFFLALPMIWLHMRSLFTTPWTNLFAQRFIWTVIGLSICSTISVETPFLLHLAGTSEWQRFSVLALGFGIVIVSAVLLVMYRDAISHTRACIVGLNTAYLANAALCLIVYSDAKGNFGSKSGWLITMVIVWPMLLEIIWILFQTFKKRPFQSISPLI